MIFYYLDLKGKPYYHTDITSRQNQNYRFTRTDLYTDREAILDNYEACYTIKRHKTYPSIS